VESDPGPSFHHICRDVKFIFSLELNIWVKLLLWVEFQHTMLPGIGLTVCGDGGGGGGWWV
jgi:hypothetical protein